MDRAEETLYEIAAVEIATASVVPGLYAKAFSDAEGDEKRAAARYIRLRVQQLKTEASRAQRAVDRRNREERGATRGRGRVRDGKPRNAQHEREARRLYDHALRLRHRKHDEARAYAVLEEVIERFPSTRAADDARSVMAGGG